MKTVEFAGKINTFQGQTIPPVDFNGKFEAFETFDEVKAANEVPTNDEIVNIVNAKRKASEVTSTRNAALEAAGFAPDKTETAKLRMIADAMKLGLNEAQAKAMVETVLAQASANKAA